jgi:mannose-6-phosphate isomerase-like protein (cupin superfamily)
MGYNVSSLDELGDGYGFRKIRGPLGVSAFGVNAIVYPAGAEGVSHFHDVQDELYFVHQGTARFEFDDGERVVGPGGLVHVESTTPRKVSNAGDDDLVLLIVGGKGGYVERDGRPATPEDLARRQQIARGEM